jgi:ribonucleoside-diphosphate reductase beta chain
MGDVQKGRIHLGSNMVDWVKLSDNTHHFILHNLAFFTASDGIVNENLAQNFMTKIQSAKGRCFYYGFQIAMKTSTWRPTP